VGDYRSKRRHTSPTIKYYTDPWIINYLNFFSSERNKIRKYNNTLIASPHYKENDMKIL